jgi:hypothetical protein
VLQLSASNDNSTTPSTSRTQYNRKDTVVDKASFREVANWQNHLFFQEDGTVPFNAGLMISGPTADSIATTLLDMLRYHYPARDMVATFHPAPGVECRLLDLTAFVQKFHLIEM